MRHQFPRVLLASLVIFESYLLSRRFSLLTRKMGIENLPGSVVRINRHSAVGTAGAAPSTAQAVCTLSPMVNPTHASRLGRWTC